MLKEHDGGRDIRQDQTLVQKFNPGSLPGLTGNIYIHLSQAFFQFSPDFIAVTTAGFT
jgi:hypothetical protein